MTSTKLFYACENCDTNTDHDDSRVCLICGNKSDPMPDEKLQELLKAARELAELCQSDELRRGRLGERTIIVEYLKRRSQKLEKSHPLVSRQLEIESDIIMQGEHLHK